jgi:hypothetical protein
MPVFHDHNLSAAAAFEDDAAAIEHYIGLD